MVGPSGAGKGTLLTKLMRAFPNRFGFTVSHTTRKPRPGEVDGVHYHFVDLQAMQKDVEEPGKFIEHAWVHGNLYGTSFAAVEAVREKGQICLLDIDVQGASQMKERGMAAKYIFIAPPSLKELERRLRGRATESDEKVQLRLQNAEGEIEFNRQNPRFFDHCLVNGDLGLAEKELLQLMRGWYPSLTQQMRVTASRSAGFYIRAARSLIAASGRDQLPLAEHEPPQHELPASELEVLALGNSLPAAAAILGALTSDGHELALVEAGMVEVAENASGRKLQTPRLRVIIRLLEQALLADAKQPGSSANASS